MLNKLMNKIMISLLFVFSMFIVSCENEPEGKYIQWGSDNEMANAMISKGMFHYYNVEWDMALSYFKAAADYDPTSFASHVMLAWMTPAGEMRDKHIANAKKYVQDKNETSKLFVSLLELAPGDDLRERRHAIWSQMHELEPRGNFIHYYYAWTKPSEDERVAELEVLMEKLKTDNRSYAHVVNSLAYGYYDQGDKEKAKEYFEEYLKLYPGNNSNDSMGEYYYNEKDYENSLKYYRKSLDHFRFSISGTDKVRELNELLKK
tara:strand:- start:1203 stop:1988 length:786 start_codon:yes stop_codon:yes gene_type:complete